MKITFFSSSGSGDIHEKQSLSKQLDSCFCKSLYIAINSFFAEQPLIPQPPQPTQMPQELEKLDLQKFTVLVLPYSNLKFENNLMDFINMQKKPLHNPTIR